MVFDDRQRQSVLGPEVKVQRTLGHVGVGKDTVEDIYEMAARKAPTTGWPKKNGHANACES